MTSPDHAALDDRAGRSRWFVFVGPLVAYVLAGYLVRRICLGVDAGDFAADQTPGVTLWTTITTLVVTAIVIAAGAPRLIKSFPIRISGLSILVGLVGGVAWIGLCRLDLESMMLGMLALEPDFLGQRDAINPWMLYHDKIPLTAFLISRFALLIVAVPIAEELMLRGFLIRAIDTEDWHRLPLNQIGRRGVIAASVYGVVSHPMEMIAAAVWFSLITWMMLRTNRFWDCVVAHAITNAMLGVYIVASGDWRLW